MRQGAAAAAVLAAGYAGLQWLGRTSGTTRAERRRALPGDSLCPAPQMITNHAVTVAAPPERIWPWPVQMGRGRAGWYTARWVDRLLFPAKRPSATAIVPALQHLAVGDRIRHGPPQARCAFLVDELAPRRHLLPPSREHRPPGWADRFGAAIDWAWAFVLDPVEGDRTRFLRRSRMLARGGSPPSPGRSSCPPTS